MSTTGLQAPIGILDEHPDWSRRLTAELAERGLAPERIDHSAHAYDPRDRRRAYSVIVNRTSPSSHTRGHAGVLFYAEALLAHYEALGVPVINPVAAYRFEKSKALQLGLFERLEVPYPRSVVVNHPARVLEALDRVRFPLVVKPNVGGSGAGIRRFDSRAELQAAIGSLPLGPDGTALVQEYVEPAEGAIVRVEVLGGRYLYAIRIERQTQADFNLCPADICQLPPGAAPGAGAPDGVNRPGLRVSRYEAPGEVIDTVLRIAAAASIDVGGVEYLTGRADGRRYFYDVNATSNFVADAPAVLGFDPTARFADFIVAVARRRARAGGRRALAPAS